MFQSPLGEVVKETRSLIQNCVHILVQMFQSPLGEVVKETNDVLFDLSKIEKFQSPLGEVVKETRKCK